MFKIFSIDGGICASEGFFADGINCGLKESELDLAFFRSEVECEVGAVFTSNRFKASPVIYAMQNIDKKSSGMIINSKNANAMTGEKGIEDIKEILSHLPNFYNPLMSSTGVIGEFLPKQKIIDGIKKFNFNAKNHTLASKAIMTTDRWNKEIAFKVVLENGDSFKIGAMAKGAGMIAPNMATMLCFISTDAKIQKDELQEILNKTTEKTFNAVSVDGDTSTNDSVFVFANGLSGCYDKEAFSEALRLVMHNLSLELVKDGEGATKLVSFEVIGAKDDSDAKKIAKNLSNSLLVKTALFGADPNWGRLAMAIGSSKAECYENKLTIKIGEVTLFENGINLMDKTTEEKAYQQMQKDEFKIVCDIGIGDGCYTAYGCDLGYEYVKINADYRT